MNDIGCHTILQNLVITCRFDELIYDYRLD